MKRDLSFEALADETGTDWATGRGELNKALASIRGECELRDDALADEIHVRASMYRKLMPSVLLTPTALAKHWRRVKQTSAPRKQAADCARCDNHRLVVAEVRDDGTEAYKPCPDCGAKKI